MYYQKYQKNNKYNVIFTNFQLIKFTLNHKLLNFSKQDSHNFRNKHLKLSYLKLNVTR